LKSALFIPHYRPDEASLLRSLIKANADSSMVVINQIQPIYVTFSIPEHSLAEIKKYMAIERVQVEAVIGKDDTQPVQGVLTFVDNAVDTTTGTIKLKASFANREKRLWPGLFVSAAVTLTQCDSRSFSGDPDRAGGRMSSSSRMT
jgi:multidrug efflux system membrane fusion protein